MNQNDQSPPPADHQAPNKPESEAPASGPPSAPASPPPPAPGSADNQASGNADQASGEAPGQAADQTPGRPSNDAPAGPSQSDPDSGGTAAETETQQTTPAGDAPATTGAPATDASEPNGPVELSADIAAAADAAMASAAGTQSLSFGGISSGTHPGKPSPEQVEAADKAAHRAVRGPRVVESGREYREGVVVSVGPEDIFVEFGPKSLGVLPRVQFKEKDGTENEAELPKPGETIKVAVDRYEAKESLYICSRPGAVQKADWELLQPGQIVEARVTGTNKGGLECEVAKHRAFMPASLVSDQRIDDLSVFVGEKIECKVIKVDRSGKGNITLSRREVLAEEKKKAAQDLKNKLKEGDVLEGKVKKIMPFGAFVDIGGVDGLVHISDISHDRVGKVENHLKEGQDVRVQVLKLDWEKGRHSLGMKQLQDDPFEVSLNEIEEGSVVSGRVTKLLDFGAFIEIAEGVEGLCHISELDWRRIEKVSDAVQPGQIIDVKVLKIDNDQRRISLSIKQAKDRPAQAGGPRGGGGGRGRGRGDRDDRSPDEILKETPALRRMREQAKQKKAGKKEKGKGSGGLGDAGGLGIGLGDLKL
jgi:small subunit ribosomal protein S1